MASAARGSYNQQPEVGWTQLFNGYFPVQSGGCNTLYPQLPARSSHVPASQCPTSDPAPEALHWHISRPHVWPESL